MKRHVWRDCQAWKDEGLPLSTTSNEAAKLYDANVTQLIGLYDEPEVGGIVKSMEDMHKADPEFLLGRAFNLGVSLSATIDSTATKSEFQMEYSSLKRIYDSWDKNSATEREFLHVKAVLLWAEGKVRKSIEVWENILLDHPTDLYALRMAYISYLYLGNFHQMRDCPIRVLPAWNAKNPPLKSFLYGLYAFGLEETSQFAKAELYARKGLEENMFDGWATHSLAHVFETEGRTTEGIQFMNSTVQNWEKSNQLAGHNHWHVALFHLENEEYESAVEILEKEILSRLIETKSLLSILDSSSLLYRLHILSPSSVMPTHWETAYKICRNSSKPHISTFNDAHLMMTCSGYNQQHSVEELLESVKMANMADLTDHSNVAAPLLQSLADFKEERYENVVEAIAPIKYELVGIGGSSAQRDVFNLVLIAAALKSQNLNHRKLAKSLIYEREATKSTPLGRRFKSMANSI